MASQACVVVPAVCGERWILWSGWHGVIDNGSEGVTVLPHTIYEGHETAIVEVGGEGGGLLAGMFGFYDGTEVPADTVAAATYTADDVDHYYSYGVAFETAESDVELCGVQFYRYANAGLAGVKLFADGALVASGSGIANPGWNVVRCGPYLLEPGVEYIASWESASTPASVTSPGTWPKSAGLGPMAETVAIDPGRTPGVTFDRPTVTSGDEFFVGPAVREAASAAWYDGTEAEPLQQPDNVGAYGVAFDCLADGVICSGVMLDRTSGEDEAYVRLWSSDGVLLGSGVGVAGVGWNRVALDAPVALAKGQSYVVDWRGGFHGKDTSPTWAYTITLGATTVAQPVAVDPGRSGGTSTVFSDTAEDIDYFVSPVLEGTVPGEPDIIVVATPAPGTEPGVYVALATSDHDNIYLYWSEASKSVSAHVMAIGGKGTRSLLDDCCDELHQGEEDFGPALEVPAVPDEDDVEAEGISISFTGALHDPPDWTIVDDPAGS